MAKPQKRPRDEDEDLPSHELPEDRPENRDGGGVTVDLDKLPDADKKKDEERGAKKGGEERIAPEDREEEGALEQAESDEIRARRREEREERKQRKEDAKRRERELQARLDSTQRELQEVKEKQARGEVQDVRETVARIEGEMETLTRQYHEAKEIKKNAYEKQDGKTAVDADETMATARERYRQLGFQRDRILAETEEQQRRPRVSPQLVQHAKAFMAEHPWYDPKGGDRDSAKLLALDRQMGAEGWDPTTAGYWEELRERVREELPKRFEEGEEGEEREERKPARRQTTGGSSRDGGGERGSGNTFYLNSERVKALKDAGMWEDPVKRAKMIRRYKERDERERRERAGR